MCISSKFWVRSKPLRFFESLIMSANNEKVYYAVGRGKEIGIYESWKECKAQTEGFCKAKYRKFYNLDEAKEFVNFWKGYSSPVKEEDETDHLVSTVLYRKGSVDDERKIFQSAGKENPKEWNFVLEKDDCIPHTSSVSVMRKSDSKIEELWGNEEIIEPILPSAGQGQSQMCVAPIENPNLKCNSEAKEKCNTFVALNSQNSTLDDYSDVFSISKPFVTSTQETVIKQEVVDSDFKNCNEKARTHKEMTNELITCMNTLESGFKVIAIQSTAESQRLKNLLKTITKRIFTDTNTNVNLQMETDGNLDRITEGIKTENGQPTGKQSVVEHEGTLHLLQSPSRAPHVHLQCPSPHSTSYEGRLSQKDVDVLALNLRLDSFEKRFDSCLKEVGGLVSEISNLKTEIKELKETIKSISNSASGSSPRKGRDGLMQTTLSFNPGSPNKVSARSYAARRDSTDSGEPEQKRGRTVKRKLSRADSLSDDNIDNLINNLKPEIVDLSSFTVDDDDYVEVYTDGSALSNGKKEAKAGIGIWFGDDHPLNVAEPVAGPATSITAEIQAARVAVQLAIRAGIRKLKIHTDSEFLINCATKWIHRWKTNGWTLKGGGPVKNRKELEKLDHYASQIKVQWEKVAAHSKIKGNETADRLANQGAARYER